jgi:hypothetical protein
MLFIIIAFLVLCGCRRDEPEQGSAIRSIPTKKGVVFSARMMERGAQRRDQITDQSELQVVELIERTYPNLPQSKSAYLIKRVDGSNIPTTWFVTFYPSDKECSGGVLATEYLQVLIRIDVYCDELAKVGFGMPVCIVSPEMGAAE